MNELNNQSFGLTPFFFLIQGAILLVWIVLAIVAIRKAAKNTTGAATPVWILLVLVVPFIGAIATIACVKQDTAQP